MHSLERYQLVINLSEARCRLRKGSVVFRFGNVSQMHHLLLFPARWSPGLANFLSPSRHHQHQILTHGESWAPEFSSTFLIFIECDAREYMYYNQRTTARAPSVEQSNIGVYHSDTT
jgi:hypothetical protein